jgi:hypothetical protein
MYRSIRPVVSRNIAQYVLEIVCLALYPCAVMASGQGVPGVILILTLESIVVGYIYRENMTR